MVERQAVNLEVVGSNPTKSDVSVSTLTNSKRNKVVIGYSYIKMRPIKSYIYIYKDVDCASLLLRELGLMHASDLSLFWPRRVKGRNA